MIDVWKATVKLKITAKAKRTQNSFLLVGRFSCKKFIKFLSRSFSDFAGLWPLSHPWRAFDGGLGVAGRGGVVDAHRHGIRGCRCCAWHRLGFFSRFYERVLENLRKSQTWIFFILVDDLLTYLVHWFLGLRSAVWRRLIKGKVWIIQTLKWGSRHRSSCGSWNVDLVRSRILVGWGGGRLVDPRRHDVILYDWSLRFWWFRN